MAVIVKPDVLISGQLVACRADALDSEPVVIRGFEITWGRDEYMSPDVSPASVTLTLLDTTGMWAQRIRDTQAIGLPVEIRWQGTTTDTPSRRVGPVVMFRGRVTQADAAPHSLEASDGRTAWTVELVCADRTADMGNALAGPEPWDRETMLERAVKIRDLATAAGSGIGQVYFWPGYVDSTTAPLEVKGKSALELMGAFFRSMGNDSYAYDPDANVIRQAIRLSQPMTTYLATFDDKLGAVLPVASDITVDGQVYPGIGLGGCELVGKPSVSADPSTDINRLECSWKDFSTDHGDMTTVHENKRAGDARRVMSWESWLDNGIAIDPTLDNVWNRAREEGRRPRHPDFTYKPGHSFVSERMARWMLSTWENTRAAFISGNLAYQWLMGGEPGYSPVVAPIGGATRFDPETGWHCQFKVHWIHNTTPASSPATWSSIRQVKTTTTTPTDPWWWKLLGLPPSPPVTVGSPTPERDLLWGDPELMTGYAWDTSVTWGDLQHVPTSGTQIKDVLS